MNKFLKRIVYNADGYKRFPQRKIIDQFKITEESYYQPRENQTKYIFSLNWQIEGWFYEATDTNNAKKEEFKAHALKALQNEIFGELNGYIHELLLHIHNEDFDECLNTVALMKLSISGE